MPNPILWLPILTALGEEELARILDKSPDTASALLEAHANFQQAQADAEALRHEGHEGSTSTSDAPPLPPPPGEVQGPG